MNNINKLEYDHKNDYAITRRIVKTIWLCTLVSILIVVLLIF